MENLNENELESDYINVPDEEVIRFDLDDHADDEAKEVEPVAEEDKPETKTEPKKRDPQKRINELVRLRHEADEQRAAAEARAALLEQENKALAERFNTTVAKTVSEKEKELLARKEAARADSDIEALDRANDELWELRLKRENKEFQVEPTRQVERQPEPNIHPSAAQWLSENSWFSDASNAHLNAEVLRIENELRTTKRLPYGPELYKAINERLDELPEFDDVRERKQEVVKPKSIVAPPSKTGVVMPREKPGVLTEKDKAAILASKLDPNDPKVRDTYLKYKRK